MSTPPGFVPVDLPPRQVETLPPDSSPAEPAAVEPASGLGAVRLIAVLFSLAA